MANDILKRLFFMTDMVTAYRMHGIDADACTLMTSSTDDTLGTPMQVSDIGEGHSIRGLTSDTPDRHTTFKVDGTSVPIYLKFYDSQQAVDPTGRYSQRSGIDCVQILGHNLASAEVKVSVHNNATPTSIISNGCTTLVGGANAPVASSSFTPTFNGFSVCRWNTSGAGKPFTIIRLQPANTTYASDIHIGSVRVGQWLRTEHACDISEQNEKDFGIRKLQSMGGVKYSMRTRSNPYWVNNMPPMTCFHKDDSIDDMSRSGYQHGKKTYKCSFSYVSDDEAQGEKTPYGLFDKDKSFDKTLEQCFGGAIPVIVKTDALNNDYDQAKYNNLWLWVYITKMDKTRIAPNLWNINLEMEDAY